MLQSETGFIDEGLNELTAIMDDLKKDIVKRKCTPSAGIVEYIELTNNKVVKDQLEVDDKRNEY